MLRKKQFVLLCGLITFLFFNFAYSSQSTIVCPTNILCQNGQCISIPGNTPWGAWLTTSGGEKPADGTYNFIRVDAVKNPDSTTSAICWLEDSLGQGIKTGSQKGNNVYPATGGQWSGLTCQDFDKHDPSAS